MPKLQQTKDGQFLLCIPKELVRAKRWIKSQEILLIFNERGNIELKELASS